MFSAKFYKQDDENGQLLDEIELFTIFNINGILTEKNSDNNNVKFQSEHQILNQETEDSRWIYNEIISRTIFF